MQNIKKLILVAVIGLTLTGPSLFFGSAFAAEPIVRCNINGLPAGCIEPTPCVTTNPDVPVGCAETITSSLPKPAAGAGVINTVLSIVFAITGALSLLTITISGFRFVISRGDSQRVAQARGAIIYAIVGLVIAISGMAIETFVINKT